MKYVAIKAFFFFCSHVIKKENMNIKELIKQSFKFYLMTNVQVGIISAQCKYSYYIKLYKT